MSNQTDSFIVNISSEKPDVSANGIWILHADKIPPHIGFVHNQLFFSLKASGIDYGVKLSTLSDVINKKGIVTVIAELTANTNIEEIQKVFAHYSTTIPGAITCLHPIKELLNCKSATKLTDLLDTLENRGIIKHYSGINIPNNFKGIPHYTEEDIHNRLEKLKKDRAR